MLTDTLLDDQKSAMRSGDRLRLQTIRSLRAALTSRAIELRKGGESVLSADEEIRVVQKQAKQRRDSIDQFRTAGREDLAAQEEQELAIIESYLPVALSDDELATLVSDVIRETEAASMADMARVMPLAIERSEGRADGKRISAEVRRQLSR
jgi:uncharacterized protein